MGDDISENNYQNQLNKSNNKNHNNKYYYNKEEIDYSKLKSIDDLPSDDSVDLSSCASPSFPNEEEEDVYKSYEDDDDDDDSISSNEKNNMSIGEKLAYVSNKPLKSL